LKRIIALGSLAAAAVVLSGCATITRGTSQKFAIETSPDKADVKLSTGQTCVSPCKLKLKRKEGFVVTATKSGYEKASTTVQSKVKGGGAAGAAGNMLLGGVIGIAVDATNGSMNDLTPNPVYLELKPLAAVAAPAPAAPTAGTAEPVADTAVAPAPAATDAPTAEASPAAAPAPGAQ
jgi:hypothetical protein